MKFSCFSLSNLIVKILGILVALALWEAFAIILDRSVIAPTLGEIFLSLLTIFKSGSFFTVLFTTMLRIILTLIPAIILSLLFGIPAGLFPKIEVFLSTAENIMRATPTMAILLLALIWFNSEFVPLFVTGMIVFPILYRGTVDGVKNISVHIEQMSVVFKVSFWKKLKYFYFPTVEKYFSTALFSATGLAVKVMITAEVLSQPRRGVGTEFQLARSVIDTPALFAWAVIVISLAVLFQLLNKLLFNTKKRAKYKKEYHK